MNLSSAMRAMLKMAIRNNGAMELGELVMECATAYDSPLAWRIADRTAGALIRRGLIDAGDYTVHVTAAGLEAMQ